MATGSSIEWTDATWNPVAGCTPVSAGCKNCYAARMALRLSHMPNAVGAKYRDTAKRTSGGLPVFTGVHGENSIRVAYRASGATLPGFYSLAYIGGEPSAGVT